MRSQRSSRLAYAFALAALLLSIACDSDSANEPQSATGSDASAARDGEADSEKPRTSQKSDERTKREDARDSGSSEAKRDASVAKPERDAAVKESGRDAAASDKTDGNPVEPAEGLDAGVEADAAAPELDAAAPELDAAAPELDAAAPELDAATADGGETDASLADLQASITNVEVSGSLCPEGTYDVSVSGDLAALTLVFAGAELQSDAAQSLDKACDITLTLDVPEGFQVGKISVQPTGYVFTEQGSASVELTYAFPTSGASRTFSHPNLTGDQTWQFDDAAEDIWSPTCAPDSNRDVSFTIHLGAGLQGVGYLNVNAIDLDLAALRGVTAWRACEMVR